LGGVLFRTMWVSATYICPVRGLADLDPPDPTHLGKTARIARSLGVDRLVIPVLEESLLRSERMKVRFLDGLIQGLNQAEDAGMAIWLLAPAQRMLGVDWVAPYLVSGSSDPRAAPVFVDGALRTLNPFTWWADPSIVRKRLESFRELVAALSGHAALTGWVIMDRGLEWPTPAFQTADLILRSYCAEIRSRDETGEICLSIGVSALRHPQLVHLLVPQVDALYIRNVENRLDGWKRHDDSGEEIVLAAYLCSMANWLFGKEVSPEIGWSLMMNGGLREETLSSVSVLGQQEVPGVTWLNLIDPEMSLCSLPPWGLYPGLQKSGLLDQGGEPKEGVEAMIREIRSMPQTGRSIEFIDIDQEDYSADPETHFRRLWDHFREAAG
jgi:hypothetical protein